VRPRAGSSHVAAGVHVVAVPGAAARTATAAASDFGLGLRPRGWLDILDVAITVTSWHVDLLGRLDLTLLTLDPHVPWM